MIGYVFKPSRPFFLFIISWFLFLSSKAQTDSTKTLQQLITAALAHSPALRSREALINSSKADIKSVKDAFLPTATVGDEMLIASANSLPGSYLSMGVIPSTSSSIREDNIARPATGNFALLMSQYEIASFGYRDARIKNAEATVSLRQSELSRDSYVLKWQLARLYFTLLKQQLQLGIEQQNVQRYEDLYKVIQAITYAGLRPGADSSQALAELSKTRINLYNTAKLVRLSKSDLSYYTALPSDSIAADTTEQRNRQLVLQVLQSSADSLNSPLLAYYQSQQNVLESNEELIAKSYRPHLMLTGMTWTRSSSIDYTGNYKSLASGIGVQRWNYLAGVSVFYNLVSGVQKRDRLTSARLTAQAGQLQVQQQQESLANSNRQADEAIFTAAQTLAELPVQLRAANDAFNQKTAQYKAGIINLVDLTNATYVLYRAQTDYAQALNDWFLANVDKAAVTGRLDAFIQSVQ